jgi:hypothetical protein
MLEYIRTSYSRDERGVSGEGWARQHVISALEARSGLR